MSADPETAMTATDEAGRFTFLGIPPGQYVARILKTPRPASSGATELTQAVRTGSGVGGITVIGASSSLPGLPADPTWWAETPVSVGERPVEGVSLTLRQGLRISGRVEFVGNSTRPAISRLGSVTIERADGSSANTVATSSRFGRIDAQGNLSTYGQVPGHYLVRMSSAVPGWYFAGAMLGGRDVSVTPLELTDAHVEGVVLTFTDTPLAEISGTVTLDRAGADEDATVVVFPANPNLWTKTYEGARNLRSVAVTRGSRYVAGNLPPGEYFVAGVAGPPPLAGCGDAGAAREVGCAREDRARRKEDSGRSRQRRQRAAEPEDGRRDPVTGRTCRRISRRRRNVMRGRRCRPVLA